MSTKKVHVIRQLCLYRTFKEYWFLRKSKFTLFVNQERQSESVREWEIASAVQTGACQRVITAQGLWELQQWRFCDTGDIRACSLHHSRPCLRTQPHPRHFPSVTGSSLSDNHHHSSIYTCFTSSLYHFVLCICLVGLWIPPFVIIQPRTSQRDEMKINSFPLPPLTTFLSLSRSC